MFERKRLSVLRGPTWNWSPSRLNSPAVKSNNELMPGSVCPLPGPGLLRPLATTCVKPFPYNEFDPHSVTGVQFFVKVSSDPAFQGEILSHAGLTPPDPDRRLVSKAENKRIAGHGFSHVDP